jgi:guanylate kinase
LKNSKIDFNIIEKTSLMFIISGPSGVGKDAVLRSLKKRDLPFHHVVTANTRKPRPGEAEGVDYFFVSKKRFEEMIRNEELIEYSEVYQDYKGIPKSEVRKAFGSKKDLIFRLDVQGAEKIKALYPQAILIFLVPTNQDEWFKRLSGRRHSKDKDLATRIKTVKAELEKVSIFDYIVVNQQDKLAETIKVIEAIITAEHHRTHQQKIKI